MIELDTEQLIDYMISLRDGEKAFRSTINTSPKFNATASAILIALMKNPDGIEPLKLAEICGVLNQTLTFPLDKLESQGLLERRPFPGDKRRRLIFLTDDGKAAAEECNSRRREIHRRLIGKIDRKELIEYLKIKEKISKAGDEVLAEMKSEGI